MRKTQRELSRLFEIKKTATPGYVPDFQLIAITGDKKLRFHGQVTIDGTLYECANDSGSIKTFGDIDDYLKYVAKACEKGDGVYTVSADTGSLLASSVATNMQVWAANQIVKLGRAKTKQEAVVVKLDASLSLMVGWEAGNAAQQARKAELEAQKVAVNTDIAAIDTEVARLTVIANS